MVCIYIYIYIYELVFMVCENYGILIKKKVCTIKCNKMKKTLIN